MSGTGGPRQRPPLAVDPDNQADVAAVHRTSRVVGLQIAVACSIVVAVVLLAVVAFVLSQISPTELFEPVPDPDNINISAVVLLRAAVLLGVLLVVLAGILSWVLTRRAVRPLGDALRMQRSFVADASHELRTPLTVLDARLQVLQRSLPPGDPSAAIVTDLRRDAGSLIRVVNDLLESAEVGAAAPSPGLDAGLGAGLGAELGPALELAVESMRVLAAAKSVSIAFERPDGVVTPLSATGAQRCLVALLDNALRYSPAGSRIDVGCTVSGTGSRARVTIEVRDRGGGIRGIDPGRIFDRFAHSGEAVGGGGDARTGFGIGLALVRDIVVRAGGSVRVVHSSPAGTAIAIAVPVAHIRSAG
ncbi:MAG: HAMP domain-containing histidine kinase [Burkholderiaceae bacterium]|nr:HAMP domain-containing histidine kinase [Microbacteriaceae bacterium]